MQTLEEFEFPFERLKHILGDQYKKPEDKKKQEQKDEKDDEEPMIQELTDE